MHCNVNQRIYLQMKVQIQIKSGYKVIDLNRRRAIRERCLNCSGWVPKEVLNCEFFDCCLYSFRSGKGKQNPKSREKAIRQYCLRCMCGQRSEVSKCVSNDCPLFPYRMNGIDSASKMTVLLKKGHIEAVSEVKN
jgi:hypothetical protein